MDGAMILNAAQVLVAGSAELRGTSSARLDVDLFAMRLVRLTFTCSLFKQGI